MAPLLNLRTASMINKLLEIFRRGYREIPSDIRGTVCFPCFFVFALIYIYFSVFVVYFVLAPLLPHFHPFLPHFHPMPTIELNSITVKSLNTQSINLMGTFDITFEINTFKCENHTITYHDLEVKVWSYGNDNITLAASQVSPFTQGSDSVTKVNVVLKVADGFNYESDVVEKIADEFARGSVNFGVSLSGFVRFIDQSSVFLKFVCNPVVIVFPPNSNDGVWKKLVFPCPKSHRKFVI